MSQLSAPQIKTIVELVQPACDSENERRTLIDLIFAGAPSKPDIDTSGAPLEFTRRLVFRLIDYGEIAPGQPALWALLEAIRPQVGVDKQQQIDDLHGVVFAAAVPAADYIVATEGGKLIFISYSTVDGAFADRLRADLSAAGLNLWIDRIGLKVGTRNWEDAIREALKRADGVLLIASPASRRSRFVRDELAIAEDNDKPIFPVWADGDKWSDAITMGFGTTQYVDLRGDRYAAGLRSLIEALGGIPPTSTARAAAQVAEIVPITREELPPPPPDFVPRNPYKGLKAFRADDRADFFGREAFVNDLLQALRENPQFLAVIGSSGSGKSSVVMAGLLPRLQDGGLPGSDGWVYLDPFVPGVRPIEALSIALARHLPHKAQAAIDEDLLHPSARGLHRLAKQISQTRLVLYIDQFEELFTQTADDAERRQFIDLLTTAAHEPDSAVTILLTLRADFYDRPLGYADLGALFEAHGKAILPLTLADLYDVILKPAALEDVRLTFEPGLAEDMVFSVKGEAGALPLLQFTLDQLFQRREGLRLTRAAYDALGGVRGALAKHAEATYQTLDVDRQRLARGLFLRLIEPGATEQDTTRRRARMSELTLTNSEQTERLRTAADTFVQARLLTTDSAAGEDTLEVSHEALIREWERLKAWLNEAREDVTLMKRIAADADEWRRKGQPEDALYRGRRLREAQEWARANSASMTETAFIAASETTEREQIAAEERRKQELIAAGDRAERQRRRARTAIIATGVIGVVAAGLILAAVQRSNEASVRESAALAQVGTATVVQGEAQARADAAGTQVADANATLTPIPGTLAAANEQVVAANTAQFVAEARAADANTQVADAAATLSPIPGTLAAADDQLSRAAATLGYVQAQGTEVAAQATYFGIEQARIGTLAAGAVVIPPGTLTPELLLPTLTGIAQLRQWEPRISADEIEGVRIEMVEVPPGCFMMGSVAGGDEGPVHEQCFTEPFYIDRYEVTQGQFTALKGVMEEDFEFSGDNRPVENINWFEAHDFCEARGARLPTEREWEYAARGPDSLTYPWGNIFVPENAVYSRVESQGTADVVDADGNPARPNGASWVGALDMSGNVYEWTSTRYDDLDYSQRTLAFQGLFPYPYRSDDGREADETLAAFNRRTSEQSFYTLRVVRGGSWFITDTILRGAARDRYFADFVINHIGFRCARSR